MTEGDVPAPRGHPQPGQEGNWAKQLCVDRLGPRPSEFSAPPPVSSTLLKLSAIVSITPSASIAAVRPCTGLAAFRAVMSVPVPSGEVDPASWDARC